jgi:hypothetical protein
MGYTLAHTKILTQAVIDSSLHTQSGVATKLYTENSRFGSEANYGVLFILMSLYIMGLEHAARHVLLCGPRSYL